MAVLRTIVVLAAVVCPQLLASTWRCAPTPSPYQSPICCQSDCSCGAGCECSADEPQLPERSDPAPAPAPTSRAGDLLSVLLPAGGLIGIVPATMPPPHGPCVEILPHRCCSSINALHCIWTT